MRWTYCFLVAIHLLFVAPIRAEVSDADWRTFKTGSLSEYRTAGDPLDWEDHLFDAAKAERSQAKALQDFARRIGVPSELAQQFATVIVQAVVRQDAGCRGTPCQFQPGDPLYERVKALSSRDPTGQLLIIIAKNGHGFSYAPGSLVSWLELVFQHPAARPIFETMADYTEEDVPLIGLLASTPPADWDARLIATSYRTERGSSDPSGWMSAFLESAEQRATEVNAPTPVLVALAQTRLLRDIDLGLTRIAVARYRQYPVTVRAQLPLAPAGCPTSDRCALANIAYAWVDAMVAALWQEGFVSEAQILAQQVHRDWPARDAADALRGTVLAEFMKPRVADADLFELLVYGRLLREPLPEKTQDQADELRDREWLSMIRRWPALRPLAVQRLRAAGYGDLMRQLQSASPNAAGSSIDASVLAVLARHFPISVTARQRDWQNLIGTQGSQARAPLPATAVDTAPPVAAANVWREEPLPQGVRAWREGRCRATSPKNRAPVPAGAVVRQEVTGAESAVLYQSSDFDLPGEIPAYGLWLARTLQGQWQTPMYLGLQQHFPYVPTPCSSLPLLVSDQVQLEVQIREIDPESITFPPIAIRFKRSVDGLVLRASVASLLADQDHDGLTDLEEQKLRLAADRRDTDGDGLDDGHDPLPLVAYREDVPQASNEMVSAFLESLLGHDAGAIVVGPRPDGQSARIEDMLTTAPAAPRARQNTFFLVAPDPSVFAGISAAPIRIMIYATSEFDRSAPSGAPFYPPRIVTMFSSLDGRRTYIEWSASWTGGTLLIDCTQENAPCQREMLSQWIT